MKAEKARVCKWWPGWLFHHESRCRIVLSVRVLAADVISYRTRIQESLWKQMTVTSVTLR